MEIFRITNTNEPYTLLAPNSVLAWMAVNLLSPAYSVECPENPTRSAKILTGWDECLKKTGMDSRLLFLFHLLPIADVLDSVLIGTVSDRKVLDMAMQGMTEEQRGALLDEYRAAFLDEYRASSLSSSIDDVGEAAKRLAQGLRKSIEKDTH